MGENPNIEKIEDDGEDLRVPDRKYEQVSDEDRELEDATEAYAVEKTADIDIVMDETWDILVKQNGKVWPDIMQRAGVLVRHNAEQRCLEEYRAGPLQMRMAQTMEFFVKDAKGKRKQVEAPRSTASHIIERTEHHGAPRVDQVMRLPFLGVERKVVAEEGYHPAERALYVPELDITPHLSEDPDVRKEEVDAAVYFLLDEWLGDFTKFCGWDDDPASQANAVGFALTPFIRPYIAGPTPMHIVTAPDAGCGKSAVAELVGIVACGGISMTRLEKWGSEFKREITSFLMKAQPIVWFDNEDTGVTVDSGMLASLLSGPSWQGRVMGTSSMPDLPIRCAWVMTGTNIRFTKELADRGVLIELHLGPDGVPIRRRSAQDLKRANIQGWTMENRAHIANALLTLVENWARGEITGSVDDEGEEIRPLVMGPRKGNYDEWARCVGGILQAAGISGFLENQDAMLGDMDSETTEVEGFLGALFELGNSNGAALDFVTSDIAEKCRIQPLMDQLPQALTGLDGSRLNAALGNWLRGHKDTWNGPFRITATGAKSHKKWRLEVRS